MMHDRSAVSRVLNEREQQLLLRLIAVCNKNDNYKQQIDHLRVTGRCNCGCPTVDLCSKETEHRPKPPHKNIVDAEFILPNGHVIGVILWANDGQIMGLELYPCNFQEPFEIPELAFLANVMLNEEAV